MEAIRPQEWRRQAVLASAVILMGPGVLTSCGEDSSDGGSKDEDSSVATWIVARDEALSSDTTRFKAIVTRVGCSSGVQGDPEVPEIAYTESEVQITFTIAPRIESGTCEGAPGVPYEVELDEPLGSRSLVDGECHPGSTAWATAFCQDDGVRYRPS